MTPTRLLVVAFVLACTAGWASATEPIPVASSNPGITPFKADLVARLLKAKKASNMTFTQISRTLGLTNIYTAQLFFRNQMLTPATAIKLKAITAININANDFAEMQTAPSRRFDPNSIQDPTIYRLYEAIMLSGDSIKAVINEEFGDGIMSAIGFFMNLDRGIATNGDPRVRITMNGKYLVMQEQTNVANNFTMIAMP